MLTVLPCFTLIIRSFCIKPLCRTATAKSLQSHPTPCDPVDGSPPGSPVPGTLQARTLEWVAISFSSAWKWKVKVKSLSHVRLFATPWNEAYQAPPPMGFSRHEYWSGLPLPSPVSVSRDMKFSSIHLPGLGPTWLIPPQKGYLQTWWLPAWSLSVQFSSVAESCLTPWDPMDWAHQASMSITNSWSLLKLMSIESGPRECQPCL